MIVPIAKVNITMWAGCYKDSWQGLMVDKAFTHPAKYARGLIHRIYRHLLDQGYVQEGMTVIDPFGGVALGALDAMTYGLRWLGCELEPHFVALGQANLTLWHQRYGLTGAALVQGDSRHLRAVLGEAGMLRVACSSPPFCRGSEPYGQTDRPLGTMAAGEAVCSVSSPPYNLPMSQTHNGDRGGKRGTTPSEEGAFVKYGTTDGQLEGCSPDRFWSAAAQIVDECSQLLKPGGYAVWVVKDYVSKGKVIPFCNQWLALCEAYHFTLVEAIHASLVEDHGTQGLLFGTRDAIAHSSIDDTDALNDTSPFLGQKVTTEHKSFFRRLGEKRGSPRIDYETVLMLRTASGEEPEAGSEKATARVETGPQAQWLPPTWEDNTA